MLDIRVSEIKAVTVLEVSGRVDSVTASEMGTALSNAIGEHKLNLVLDASSVVYMSSAGLREMVSALRKVRREGGDLRLSMPSPRVLDVLDMAGLTSIFQIFSDQTEAVNSY